MAKPRVTATSRLADVIEVVELGRRTGLLMVERGSGEMMEEGAIYFHVGRAMYAAVERVRGQDALAVLGGWGACRFSFDPNAARPAPNIAPPQPTQNASASQESWTATPPGYYSSPSRVTQRGPATPRSWPSPTSQPPAGRAVEPAHQPAHRAIWLIMARSALRFDARREWWARNGGGERWYPHLWLPAAATRLAPVRRAHQRTYARPPRRRQRTYSDIGTDRHARATSARPRALKRPCCDARAARPPRMT